jgi:predicted acetyltransferase
LLASPIPFSAKELAVRLEPASRQHLDAFLECAADYRATGEDRYDAALADPEAYVRWVADMEHEETCPPGLVPQTTYWAMDDDLRVLACSRLRHGLSPALCREGGHIGYDVRPSARRRGVGTRLLALTVAKARHLGLSRVLLTCDDDNLASARIILANGGAEIENSVSDRTGKLLRRFWIQVP